MEATKIQYKNHTIKIQYDEFCDMHPRTDCDNLGSMVMFHSRYTLPNEGNYNKNDYNSWNELRKAIIRKENPAVILPIYMYEHSGVALKVGSFQGLLPQGHAEFDTCMVGFIYISKADARKEYGWKQITKTRREQLEKYLTGDVEIYSQFLNGEVFGYVITDADDEEIEADGSQSWGYYGYDHEKSGLIEEAKNVIDWEIERAKEEEKKNNPQIEMELV